TKEWSSLMRELGYQHDYDESSPSISSLFNLTGRTALITGGGSGIGRALGLGFARFGADVAVVDLRDERASRVADEILQIGRRSEVVTADVTDWDQVEKMVARIVDAFGHVDICVNSAGGNVRGQILEMRPEDYRKVLDLNLSGTYYTSK